MNILDKMGFDLWTRVLGALPEGFFVEVSNHQLSLYYNGPRYEEITQPGGNKPTGDCAHICMHDIRSENSEQGKKRVKGFIHGEIRKEQEFLASL